MPASDDGYGPSGDPKLWPLGTGTRRMRNDPPMVLTALTDPLDSPLRRWWTDSAFDEADRTIAKMEEYGSGDLVALGQTMRRMAGRPALPAVEAMELGCLMYLLGKIERAVAAVAADRPIKDDTWFDTGVYAKMAQAARAGVWKVAADG